MEGIATNKLGKREKNAKVKEGPCIFPFKYKHKSHNECFETEKGPICATQVNSKGTLEKYGYCDLKKGTEKKTPESIKRSSAKRSSAKHSSPKYSSPKYSSAKRSSGKRSSGKKHTIKRKSGIRSVGSSKKRKTIRKSPNSAPSRLESKKYTRKLKKKTPNLIIVDEFSGEKTKPKLIVVEDFEKSQPLKIVEQFSEKMTSPKQSSAKVNSLNTPPLTKKMTPGKRLNEEYIAILQELNDIMMKQGEPFRARAYGKAVESIMEINEDITDYKQLQGKPGIGKTIMDKLHEYQTTGTLRVLERERKNPVNILTNVYGIGHKKAQELVGKNITTIEQLKENPQELNEKQRVGLKYYDDILQRIPREEIDEFKVVLDNVFAQVAPPNSKMDIVGSYRRGAKNSGDIDIIITNADNNIAAFNDFLNALIKEKIVIEVLSRGKIKSLTIGQLPGQTPRRIDFLYSPPDEYAFAILYFTGSKAFNTVMRNRALKHGYTLNEHGLSVMKAGKKGEKISIHFPDERSIFNFLNMVYKEPNERKDGRAVVAVENPTPSVMETIVATKPEENIVVSVKSSPKNKTVKKKSPESKVMEHIKEFQQDGIDALQKLGKKDLENILQASSDAYYNKNQFIMSDNEYDIVKEYIEKKYPASEELKKIGAPVEKNKVSLPFNMPSMDKIKPDTNAIEKWISEYKGPYVLSAKLDGISGLYSTQGPEPKLYTRGDGTVGQDISYMIPYLRLPDPKTPIVIRGELIMKKKTFEEKYSKKFANARNLVSGIVGQKTLDADKYRDIDFVAYEVLQPELKPSNQMTLLSEQNVDVVINETVPNVSNEKLSELLLEWRSTYIYEIDGVICTDDQIYPREDGNPSHAFAFKMVLLDQIAEAKVLNVLWAPSKDGYLKPRIQIEPIYLGGVKIEYATAFNAAFVEDNKLGIGALIKLIRSGDVIPYIQEVVQPAAQAKMPSVPYVWNETHVDIMLENPEENEVVRQKNILAFMTKLGVDGLGPGNIKKIMAAGFDSVPKILAMTPADFEKVENFKTKMATKVYNSIKEKVEAASLVDLMVATNIFGRGLGEKKMEPIIQTYPDIIVSEEPREEKLKKVLSVKGMATKSANLFVDNIEPFVNFMKEANLEDKLYSASKKTPADTSGEFYQKKVVMTGFRDKDILEFLKKQGADIMATVSKNTALVIVKSEDDMTGKAEMAASLNIPIMTKDAFVAKYMA